MDAVTRWSSQEKKQKRSPRGYAVDVEAATQLNQEYRQVVHTIPGSMQLVLISLPPGGDIAWEQHPHSSQFLRFEAGRGQVQMRATERGLPQEVHAVTDGDAVMVPPGRWHYVQNLSKKRPLKLYTVYCPPVHHS